MRLFLDKLTAVHGFPPPPLFFCLLLFGFSNSGMTKPRDGGVQALLWQLDVTKDATCSLCLFAVQYGRNEAQTHSLCGIETSEL